MTPLSGSGIAVDVPSGWEGRIYSNAPAGRPPPSHAQPFGVRAENAVLHVASFPLPPARVTTAAAQPN